LKIAVIGGGAIGLTAALGAAQNGQSVTLFDPQGFVQPPPSGEMHPRVWALGPKAISLLTELGVWCDDVRHCRYQQMRVIDATSDAHVSFQEQSLGVIVEADWVRYHLIERLSTHRIACRAEAVAKASPDGQVVLSDGRVESFDLVVFAEGRSAQAATASGFVQIDGGYRQQALVATLAATEPHAGEAFQIFTPLGPLALLPLPDHDGAHRVSLVWSVSVSDALQLQSASIESLLHRVNMASEDVRGGLDFVSDPIWIPLSQHALRRDAHGRCLAIGDTAHGILPLAGLGANLGFADVAALQVALKKSTRDGARVARTVERMRRLDQQAVAFSMGLFSDVFRSNNPMVRLGRSLALRTADRHGSLRRLIQEAAG